VPTIRDGEETRAVGDSEANADDAAPRELRAMDAIRNWEEDVAAMRTDGHVGMPTAVRSGYADHHVFMMPNARDEQGVRWPEEWPRAGTASTREVVGGRASGPG